MGRHFGRICQYSKPPTRSCGKAGHAVPLIPPNARGRADQSATLLERGAGCALLVVWTELEPEPVACEQRKDVKLDVDARRKT